MVLRVTFDTNVLDWACRPERFPKDPLQPQMQKVNAALKAGQIEGYYSATMLTIEGIMRCDRAKVFAGTRMITQPEESSVTKNADLPDEIRKMVGDADLDTVTLNFKVEQQDRQPLHPEVVNRMKAAKAMNVRVLEDVPRIGAFQITDAKGDFYLDRGGEAEQKAWIEKVHEVARAIEKRGVGFAQVKTLGQKMRPSDPTEVWFRSLDQAKDIHEERAVERAFSEWADGDSMAAHIAYGLDVFCTRDEGKTGASSSVLDPAHRRWLTTTYGVTFITFKDLAANLP